MALAALVLSFGTYLVAKGEYDLEPILGVLTILSFTLAQITSMLGISRSHSIAVFKLDNSPITAAQNWLQYEK